jgi:LacI family transcriptional regulator
MSKKVLLADIAHELGVSKTLVSLVMNNKANEHGINQETQQRVREKLREMNFQPNMLAQGFRTGKTKTIGLIVSDISNLFYSRIARTIEDYAWEKGFNVLICSTEENSEKEQEQIRLLLNRKVDGLIISSSQEHAGAFNKLVETRLPHVMLDRVFPDMLSPAVSVDNFNGAKLAAQHLLEQGIRKMALVTISPEHISTISQRIRGFESALAEAGITIPDDWYIRAPFHQIDQTLEQKLQLIMQPGNTPEAIFTLNNNLTSICLKHLHTLGVKVPGQMALIGFDDVTYFSFTQPSISAIAQPTDQIAEKAFHLLLRQIEKKRIPPEELTVQLPVNIIIRESSIKHA